MLLRPEQPKTKIHTHVYLDPFLLIMNYHHRVHYLRCFAVCAGEIHQTTIQSQMDLELDC